MNPLDFTGPQFLAFYLAALVAGCLLMVLIHRLLRGSVSPNERPANLGPYELAFLSAGGGRAVQSAAISLANRDFLRPGPMSNLVADPSAHAREPLEAALLKQAAGENGASIRDLVQSAQPALRSIEDRLIGSGHLLAPSTRSTGRWLCLLVMVAVFGIGLAKVAVGVSRDKPVAFLVIGLIVAFFLLASFVRKVPRLSAKGMAAVTKFRTDYEELHRKFGAKMPPNDLVFAVALIGTTVLTGTALAGYSTPLYDSRFAGTGGGGSSCGGSSCSSSDGGGSSCGGSGCGGCGGGGD